MVKHSTEYLCQACGYKTPKWMGKCPSCNGWDTFTKEEKVERKGSSGSKREISSILPLSELPEISSHLISTKIPEFDRVLGGGFTKNSTILLSGDPGIGKSTLLLQVISLLSNEKRICLYATGEESPEQIKIRSERLKLDCGRLLVASETIVERIIAIMEEVKPEVLVIDSIQTIYTEELDSAFGGINQIRESAARLIEKAKENNVCIFFVGHVTKDGQIAGPMTLEHMVDTVIYFEGDSKSQYRILRAIKNRFGPTDEVGIFEMSERGLIEVSNPSRIFLSDTVEKTPGSIALACIEGTRPFLVEVQALCAKTNYGVPSRICTGVDRTRIMLLVAILEKKLGLNLSDQDIYVNITGGLKINERASDLPIACAIVSSFLNKTMSRKSFLFGELGLTGEIRGSRHPLKRITEGAKLGFERCFIPLENLKNLNNRDTKLEIIGVKSVDEILDKIF